MRFIGNFFSRGRRRLKKLRDARVFSTGVYRSYLIVDIGVDRSRGRGVIGRLLDRLVFDSGNLRIAFAARSWFGGSRRRR